MGYLCRVVQCFSLTTRCAGKILWLMSYVLACCWMMTELTAYILIISEIRDKIRSYSATNSQYHDYLHVWAVMIIRNCCHMWSEWEFMEGFVPGRHFDFLAVYFQDDLPM